MTIGTLGTSRSETPSSVTGSLYLVQARGAAGQFFLGRAMGDPHAGELPLEGKALNVSGDGLRVQPFATRASFPYGDPRFDVQRLEHPEAIDEGTRLLTLSIPEASHTSFPLLFRWFESARRNGAEACSPVAPPSAAAIAGLYAGFRRHAAALKRALLHSTQVAATRDLDKLTELEGDLAIETSKRVNSVAAQLNALATRDTDLAHHLDRVGARPFPVDDGLAGWTIVAGRLSAARTWALRQTNTGLLRELNAVLREGVSQLTDLVLDHEGALDTLSSETFASYGIQPELWEANEALDRPTNALTP